MEAQFEGNGRHFYSQVSDLKVVGKRPLEWDLNDWRWDGDLFTAAPLHPAPADCASRQLFPLGSEIPTNAYSSDEMMVGIDKGKREMEKRRRGFECDDDFTDGAASLNLKLGGQMYPIPEDDGYAKNGKKTKVTGHSSNRAVCQVQDCRADLTAAKDYHRRHKVCDVHSKATKALVGDVMQRFCQQCSRFHVLEEFDEGKRSCRRRLAGHNRRRRKTHPENGEAATTLNDEQGSNYLLITLLRILSNIHASNNNSDQANDQDLLSHLLRSLAGLAGIVNDKNLAGLLPGVQDLRNTITSNMALEKASTAALPPSQPIERRLLGNDDHFSSPLVSTPPSLPSKESIVTKQVSLDSMPMKAKMSNIDLNNVYDDSEGYTEDQQGCDGSLNLGKASPSCPLWVYQDPHKYSPPQASGSGNSGSMSTLSPSSSSGEAQGRTDRIVFKLFGKDPSYFPQALRQKILDWLSNSPTDIESYIRPGCVILTIYLRMDKSKWDELFYDLSLHLRRLLDASDDPFWQAGWIYTRIQHRVAFICDGRVVLDTPLPHQSDRNCRIVNAKPIAVCASAEVQFSVKGVNFSLPTARLLCAIEGKYLAHEHCTDIIGRNSIAEYAENQTLSFTCLIPAVTGRGFIEIEDHGLSSSFFPFIVAEKEVCSEICSLESIIDSELVEARNEALDFIHEMGWLLHRSQLKSRLDQLDPNVNLFPFKRFRWLLEFSIEHDWCAVVKLLLKIVFSKLIKEEKQCSIEEALLDIGLVHRAVRRKCRSMVEALIRYQPSGGVSYLFRPDANGPGGLTPLHIAAGCVGSEQVLDALTDDPQMAGVEAWRSARDSAGLTPNDYACLRGHYSYIHLVQKKQQQQHVVVVDIPEKLKSLETEMPRSCRQCDQKVAYGRARTSLAIYRPAMLSMVAIAAVCVCVALLFKSSPEVVYVFRPFRWENLDYGSS